MRGLVYKSTGSWYQVKAEDAQFYSCRIKGKFRIQGIKSTNPVAVGDWVVFEKDLTALSPQGVIQAIEPRTNYLVRRSVNLSKQLHIIAANIDQIFLVVTLKNPSTYPAFIDRFLVSAAAYHIDVILVFNKWDTYNDEERIRAMALKALYEKIGYNTLVSSAKTAQGCDQLKALMIQKTSMFSGNSGVGKSTLINAIEPTLDLKTSRTSVQHQQGQHTTTFAQMFDLSFDARIIDTPGIRGFGVATLERHEIGDFFAEFFAIKSQCKFHNCLHDNEPQCAVKEAVASGSIAQSRYESYRGLLEDPEGPYRTDNYE
ncbi:MAG: ribosome small subunit-dependent GTPase [Bacteroidota bacterium]|jgi:ribosome biogenesis GTPase